MEQALSSLRKGKVLRLKQHPRNKRQAHYASARCCVPYTGRSLGRVGARRIKVSALCCVVCCSLPPPLPDCCAWADTISAKSWCLRGASKGRVNSVSSGVCTATVFLLRALVRQIVDASRCMSGSHQSNGACNTNVSFA
jgi:hypothetical protein